MTDLCSICCSESRNTKLPCFGVCTGSNDKAYCSDCFASIASYNPSTFNMTIECPFCRTNIEINFQLNNCIEIIRNRVPFCSLSKTSSFNKYIKNCYRTFADHRRCTDVEITERIATMCENINERKLLFNFLITSQSKKLQTDVEVPLISIDQVYDTWKKFRSVLANLREVRLLRSHRRGRDLKKS